MRFLGTPDTWHTNYEADTLSLSNQLPPRSVRRTTGSSDLVFSARRASTVAWDPGHTTRGHIDGVASPDRGRLGVNHVQTVTILGFNLGRSGSIWMDLYESSPSYRFHLKLKLIKFSLRRPGGTFKKKSTYRKL